MSRKTSVKPVSVESVGDVYDDVRVVQLMCVGLIRQCAECQKTLNALC